LKVFSLTYIADSLQREFTAGSEHTDDHRQTYKNKQTTDYNIQLYTITNL